MEPLTRAERDRILQRHSDADPAEIEADLDEYERLASESFRQDPDRPTLEIKSAAPARRRLEELKRKLFDR